MKKEDIGLGILAIGVLFLVVKNKFKDKTFSFLSVIMIFVGSILSFPEMLLQYFQYIDSNNYFFVKIVGYLQLSNVVISWHVIVRYIIVLCLVNFFYFYVINKRIGTSLRDEKSRNIFILYSLFFSCSLLVTSFPILANRLFIVCEMLAAIIISNGIYYIIYKPYRKILILGVSFVCFTYWSLSAFAFYRNGYIYEYQIWLGLLL